MPRYQQLDWLRGLAVFGIILLNINSFALPTAAYLNPAWQGLPSLSDRVTWSVIELVARLKFVNIFALLFGAGLSLQQPKGSRWLNARLGWLVVAGLLHYLLLWPGDILLDYGLCGLVVWRIIDAKPDPRQRLKLGILCYLTGEGVLFLYSLLLTGRATQAWLPDLATVQSQIQSHRHFSLNNLIYRLSDLENNLLGLVTQSGFQLSGLMLIGAALMRNGWLSGQYSINHYKNCAVLLLVSGLLPELLVIVLQWRLHWQAEWCQFYLQLPAELCSPLVSLGYIALLQAYWRSVIRHPMSAWIMQVGKMAFSNYIMDTLLGLIIFDLFDGFGYFSRWQLLLWVPLFWGMNLGFSRLWLKYFCQGPLERLWRILTRWVQVR